MSTPVITYPEVVFREKWPGWNAFLGAKKADEKKEKKAQKRKDRGK
jgi:hypothetical protein